MNKKVIDLTDLATKGMLDLARDWPVPVSIALEGDWLCWKKEGRWIEKPIGPRVLTEFVMLADAEPAAIEAYAQKYGILGLCQHGQFPAGHPLKPGDSDCEFQVDDEGRNVEPLEHWRYWSRHIKALLEIGSKLRSGRAVAIQTWRRLSIRMDSKFRLNAKGRTRRDRDLSTFQSAVNSLVYNFGQVRPALVVTEGNFVIRMSAWRNSAGLPAALTLATLSAIAGGTQIVVCDSCHKPYQPRRKPVAGRNQFCSDCGAQAAWRLSQRKRTIRLKAQDLYARGSSIEEISVQIGQPIDIIGQWLKI